MSTGDLRYWFFWFIGLLAVIGGVWIIRRALFGDREAYERRCPHCLHNLKGTPGYRCGECGRVASTEDELHFRIRHWRIAGLTILALTLGALIVIGRASERGVAGLMPTKVLLWMLPRVETTGSNVYDELMARMRIDDLNTTEWQMFIAQAAEGDRAHPPASPAWETKYGDIVSRGHGRNGLWRQLGVEADTLAMPARIELETRALWPADTPVCIELGVQDWWPRATEARIHLIARVIDANDRTVDEPLAAWRVRRGPRPLIQDALPLTLPDLPDDASGVEFEYRIERRHLEHDQSWVEVARGSRRATFFQGDSALFEPLAPVSGESMNNAVQRTFTGEATRWKAGTLRFVVRFDPRQTATPAFAEGVAIGAKVEVLYNGEPLRTSRVWWMAASGREQLGVELPEFHNPALDTASIDEGEWSVRITGDPEIALRVSGARAYWDGIVEAPLTVIEAPGESPGFDWFVETIAPADTGLIKRPTTREGTGTSE